MPLESLQAALDWHAAHVRTRIGVAGGALHSPGPESHCGAAGADGTGSGPRAELLGARLRRELAEASLAELREREASGELVRADAVRAAHARRVAGLREALLQLPARLAPILAAEGDQTRCLDLLQREIHDVMRQAASPAEAGQC